jgi:hypothetical protein
VHSDCFSLFKEQYKAQDTLERLWVALLTQSPWRGAPDVPFITDSSQDIGLVYENAERYGIPRLRSLPPELVSLIRDYSHPGTFWRYISVLTRARELAALPAEPSLPSSILSTPLCNISAWKRGEPPTLMLSGAQLPIVRLTIDSRGIKQVERLARWPPYQQRRSNSMEFVVNERDRLRNVVAKFKVILLPTLRC